MQDQVYVNSVCHKCNPSRQAAGCAHQLHPVPPQESSIDMYNNDVGKKFMKQTGALKTATLYFAS